jgi:hypothetical protein
MIVFECAFVAEHFISKMNFVKNPYSNRLDDERLERCLGVATSEISPDISEVLVTNKECPMISGSLSPQHGASSGCGWRIGY